MLDVEKAFGAVLRRMRKERGWTQENLAARADIERTFVSFLERGLRQPTLTSILKIAEALGVSAADIVGQVEAEMSKAGRGGTHR